MSKEHVQVGTSIANLVSFMKEKTALNLAESSREGGLLEMLTATDIERISSVVNSSIDQAFTLGYTEVETIVTNLAFQPTVINQYPGCNNARIQTSNSVSLRASAI